MNFGKLTDDQLLQLLKGAMAEAITRGGAVRAAAEGEVIDAEEKARIEFEVAEKFRAKKEVEEKIRIAREAEAKLKEQEIKKQSEVVESNWSIKAAAIAVIREWGYDGKFEINIWSRGADRRVYFQDSGNRCAWKWCLYVTGNQYHPPGELDGEGVKCFFDDKQDELAKFLSAIAKSWKGDVSIPDNAGSIQPSEKYLAKYRQAIGLGVKENV